MKPKTRDDIYDLLRGHSSIAALGAALELGLFQLLEKSPMHAADVSNALSIPENRCIYWMQLLADLGLLEHTAGGYTPTSTAQSAILNAYSEDAWCFLARGERERLPLFIDLPLHLGDPRSLWAVHGFSAPNYFEQIKHNPERARRFTHMLYELHQSLAETVSQNIDLTGIDRILDLGGGSGVISLKLLERSPSLKVVVVDIPHVCTVGREIADTTPHGQRIEYMPLDFDRDPLPAGFDMVLACDSADPSETLFRKIHDLLNPNGCFVIVDQFASRENLVPRDRLAWAFRGSLGNPDILWPPTITDIEKMIEETGYRLTAVTRILDDWSMITSRI